MTILFGSPGGITSAGHQVLIQGSGVAGSAEAGDEFGFALATGLLAGDDLADLVVGSPGEDVGTVGDAGAVNLLAGSATGLVNGSLATQGNPEAGDFFGAAVAPTDANGIGQWDLAVGVPNETVGPDVETGAVNLLAGSTTGPSGGPAAAGQPGGLRQLRGGHRRRLLPSRLRQQRLLRPGRRGAP